MLLYLVRHAKSSWAEAGLPDHERPLNDRGREDAPRMFARLSRRPMAPQLIIASDALRTVETAKLLRSALKIDKDRLRFDSGLYHAGPERIVSIAQQLPSDVEAAAIVGHNPGLTYAANLLAADLTLDNLPTCGIVGIHFPIKDWPELSIGTLSYLDYPKKSGGPLINDPRNP